MTAKRAHRIGWMLIATVTALSFVLDHFRMLTSHFNWFMVILLIVATALVGALARLRRLTKTQAGADRQRASSKN
ncbi:MAG: hypothetical protein O3A85_14615 [Proteobacteria bacterium]|nr:hypothetical protein [Pseudomonadota bacterium]